MRIKQQEKKVLLFCGIGLVLFVAVSRTVDYGVKHSNQDQTGKINKIVNHAIDPSVIIFGSSVSEVGIDPAILQRRTGQSVFNCSIDGTRFMQYEGLIKEFDAYSSNNKYVFLVESYFSFEKTGALTSIERWLAHIDNDNVYRSLSSLQPDLTWKCRYVPFYKYVTVTHTYYKNSAIGWKNILKAPVEDSSLGYTPVNRDWEKDADELFKNRKPFAIGLEPSIISEYIATVRQLEKNGRKVVIVLTPVFTEMLSKLTNMAPLQRTLAQIADSTGARFLDFSGAGLCSDKKMFYNCNHLNRTGSLAFSYMLADSLQAIANEPNIKLAAN